MAIRYSLFTILLFLAGCTSMIMGGGQQAGMHEQSDGRSLEQVSQDADTTQAVRNMLGGNSPLAVSTANGIVTLQGQVSSQREIQRIISQVYRINGVQGVNSQVVIKTP
jgi:osmotically-inducible protein OsmY